MTKKIELNTKFREALHLMQETQKHVFVTGKAGTGKSTLLQYFRNITDKKVAVLAPTGVAAVNVKGQTIHSFFNFKPNITVEIIKRRYKNRKKKGLYKELDAIIIDEISMVRADLFDCVDTFLRLNGRDQNLPFGGIQMIFIGDLYQLPPVVTGQERILFETFYKSPYFFDSKVFSEFQLTIVELDKIYRQTDDKFIRLLNAIRNKSITEKDIALLNKRLDSDFEPGANNLFVYLTPTNRKAETINDMRLSQLSNPLLTYEGFIEGQFDEKALPTRMDLTLKVGSQIMLVNNDSEGRWINGTIGKIINVKKGSKEKADIILIETSDGEIVEVLPHTWEMFRFYFDKNLGKLESETIGSFTQYPIILAWAITIHKSQGKTFDNVILDLDRGTFAHGQAYVALSRCTTLQGLVLKKPFEKKHVLTDWRVMKFLTEHQYKLAEKAISVEERIQIIKNAIENNKSIQITYLKTNDTKSKRTIKPQVIGEMEYQGKLFTGVEGHCFLRNDTRVFRIDRILQIKLQED